MGCNDSGRGVTMAMDKELHLPRLYIVRLGLLFSLALHLVSSASVL